MQQVLRIAICFGLVAIHFTTVALADQMSHNQSGPTNYLRFDSEVIRIFVEEDSIRIDGSYLLINDRPADSTKKISLFYPYPEDSLLAGARTVFVDCKSPHIPSRPMGFSESATPAGARWLIPMQADTIEVHTVYRQARLADYARYIVTTTRAWQRPLRSARFEFYLPSGAVNPQFSYPFEPVDAGDGSMYLYEAANFFPSIDIIATWE